MTSIAELFPKCGKLVYDARQQLAACQQPTLTSSVSSSSSWSSSSSSSSKSALAELNMILDELDRQLTLLEPLVENETPERRPVWRVKIQDLRQETQRLRQQGQKCQQQYQYHQQQQQQQRIPYHHNQQYPDHRQELFLRQRKKPFQNNNNSTAMGMTAEQDTQHLADEAQSWQQSRVMLHEIISSGQANLTHLVEQRQRLQGISRVVQNMSHRLGLTQMTMRIIERRDITDAYLVVAGMIVTMLVIYLLWF